MNTITTVVFASSFVILYLTASFAVPMEKLDNPTSGALLKNSCRIEFKDGQFSLYYQLDDGTTKNRGGILTLKDTGDNFGSIIHNVETVISWEDNKSYKVKSLTSTGKDGFTFFEYIMPQNVSFVSVEKN